MFMYGKDFSVICRRDAINNSVEQIGCKYTKVWLVEVMEGVVDGTGWGE